MRHPLETKAPNVCLGDSSADCRRLRRRCDCHSGPNQRHFVAQLRPSGFGSRRILRRGPYRLGNTGGFPKHLAYPRRVAFLGSLERGLARRVLRLGIDLERRNNRRRFSGGSPDFGQLTAALVIDAIGAFGVTQKPIDLTRVAALALVGAGLVLSRI